MTFVKKCLRSAHKVLSVVRRKTHNSRKLFSAIAIGFVVTLIPFLYIVIKHPFKVSAGWWPKNENGVTWSQRKQLSLTNTSAVNLASGTPVAVTVDTKTLYELGKIRSDCADLRIVYQSSATTFTEVTRALTYPDNGTCVTSTATKVTFSLQAVLNSTASSTSYYLYYNNLQASAVSNPETGFNFGSKTASLVCPFDGTMNCIAGEVPTVQTGTYAYSQSKSALAFNGTEYINAGSGSSLTDLPSLAMTAEAWIYIDEVPATISGEYVIVGKSMSYDAKWRFAVRTNEYYAAGLVGEIDNYQTMSTDISLNTWHHVAMTFNRNSPDRLIRLYIDGAEASYATQPAVPASYTGDAAYEVNIGRTPNGVSYFKGMIDEVRLSDTARYTSTFTPSHAPFVRDNHTKLLYHMDEDGSLPQYPGTVRDDSGNANHGTLSGNYAYVSGIISSDSTNRVSLVSNQALGSHSGIEIEEPTTNKFTNPSFESGSGVASGWANNTSGFYNENTDPKYVRFGSKSLKLGRSIYEHRPYKAAMMPQWSYADSNTKYLAQQFTPNPSTVSGYVESATLWMNKMGGTGSYMAVELVESPYSDPGGFMLAKSDCKSVSVIPDWSTAAVTFNFTPTVISPDSYGYYIVLKNYIDSSCNNEAADIVGEISWNYDPYSTSGGDRWLMNELNGWSSQPGETYFLDVTYQPQSASNTYISTSLNVPATTHTLSAYMYRYTVGSEGGTINNTVATLLFNGSSQATTTYTNVGNGWWRLTYTGTATTGGANFGVAVVGSDTVMVDGVQLEELAYATSYVDGSLGTGYHWSGTANASTSYRDEPDLEYAASGNISQNGGTINFWWNRDSAIAGSLGRYLFRWGTGSDYIYLYNYGGVKGTLFRAGFGVDGVAQSCGGFSQDPDVGEWHMYTIKWTANSGGSDSCQVYVDATYSSGGTTGQTWNFTPAGDIYVGNYTGSNTAAGGIFSDLRIYSSALTDTEVTSLYNSGYVSQSQYITEDNYSETKGQNPVAIYHFDESAGTTAYDSSQFRNDLTVTNATWDTSSVGGTDRRARALRFDGTGDYAKRAWDSDFDFGSGSFTIEGWFNHTSTAPGSGTYDYILSRYRTAGYKIYMNDQGNVCFAIDGDSTWSPADPACSTTSYADSRWHYFSAVKNSNTSITLYIDGISQASDTSLTANGSMDSSADLYIGINSDGSTGSWEGVLDEIIIYPYARSSDQLKTTLQSNQQAVMIGSRFSGLLSNGLVSYWKLDEASGTLVDASGNANTGTWNGSGTHYGVGKYNRSGQFNGTNDWINAGNSSLLRLDQDKSVTYSAWIYINSAGADNSYYNIFRYDDCDNADGDVNCTRNFMAMNIYWWGGQGFPSFFYGTTAGSSYNTGVPTSAKFVPGKWYLFTSVRDKKSNTASIYIDGQLFGSTPDISTSPATWETSGQYMMIGRYDTGAGTGYFNGKIDEARIYNRALTADDVKDLYNWAPGPVGYWDFNETSGQSIYDKSGNNLYGVIGTDATAETQDPVWKPGKMGNALYFDNTDDVATVDTNAVLDITGPITVSAWINPTDATTTHRIVSKDNAAYELALDTNRHINFGINSWFGVADKTVTSTVAVPLNQWSYVVGTFDGANLSVYVNGVGLTESTTQTSIVTSAYNLTIGDRWNGGRTFYGGIDEVKIYNYVRSAQQITQDMNGDHPTPGSPVGSAFLKYNFDEGTQDTAYSSGSNTSINANLAGASACPGNAACPTWTNDGKFGKALSFDGSSDYAQTSTTVDLSASNKMTVSFWLNWDSYSNSDMLALESSDNFNFANGGILIDPDSGWPCNGLAAVSYHNTDTRVECFDRPSTGEWHHWAVTYDATAPDIKVYIDGVEQTTTLNSAGTGAGNFGNYTWNFMSRNGASLFGPGKMDDFQLYTDVLSQDQIRMLMNQGQTVTWGSKGTDGNGIASNAAAREYCPPGYTAGRCADGQDPSPIGEWKLDENSGQNFYDTSGNNLNGYRGLDTSANTSDPTWAPGKMGSAMEFDGVNDYTRIPDNDILTPTGDMTVSLWFKMDMMPSVAGRPYYLFQKGNGVSPYASYYAIVDNSTDRIIFWWCNSSACSNSNSYNGITLQPNKWYYATFIKTGTVTRIFVNGVSDPSGDGSNATGTILNSDWYLHFGANVGAANSWFDGKIDNVRLYDYALSREQMQWEYNKGAPAVWYKFDECSGTTAYNSAEDRNDKPNAFDGTITPGGSGNTSAGTCSSGTNTEMWNNGTSGKYSASLDFDGANDVVVVNDVASDATLDVDATGQITISLWIKPATMPGGGASDSYASVVAKGDSATGSNYLAQYNGEGKMEFCMNDGGWWCATTTKAVVHTGEWQHLVYVYDNAASDTLKFYYNGKLQIAPNTWPYGAAGSVNDRPLYIGADDTSGTQAVDGQIDDVRIYRYLLDQQQIDQLYNNGAVSFGQ